MSHETFTPEEYERILKSKENPFVQKQTVTESIQKVSRVVGEKSFGFLDGLISLTIVFWYFFFTGLAILCKKPMPKQWIKIMTRLDRGIVSSKIKKTGLRIDQVKSQAQKIHKKYKVVDLDTAKTVKLPTTS